MDFKITEENLELDCMKWFDDIGYQTIYGPNIEPNGKGVLERQSLSDVILTERLKTSLQKINGHIPISAIDTAISIIADFHVNPVVANNRFHRQMNDGIPVTYKDDDGNDVGDRVFLVDFKNADNNDWVAVRQCSVACISHGDQTTRIPDVVVFLNGFPISVLELKNPNTETADIWAAYTQIQNYKTAIKDLFVFNEALIISDGHNARLGSLTADQERFMFWRSIHGDKDDTETSCELEVMIKGFFNKQYLLDYLRFFITFEPHKDSFIKKQAAYHQFHGVRKAINSSKEASSVKGDKKCGVYWHTQGSGKSLSMVFYSAMLIADVELESPTIVVVTDRNDLDDQLYSTFLNSSDLLKQTPVQIKNRDDLYEQLNNKQAGGIFFTTMQKFQPEKDKISLPALTDRHNIFVVADEAHRSQYGNKARFDKDSGQLKYGYAHHMRTALPNAGYIGFTGTPIELNDKDTKLVFGDYVDVYDIEQAQKDEATKPLFYESRMIPISEDANVDKESLNAEAEEIISGYEDNQKEKIKAHHAALEALITEKSRVKKLAKDFSGHFARREEASLSKAMIVCISRKACVQLYKEIVKINEDWHDADINKGAIKVIMTGSSSDPAGYQQHIYNKKQQAKIANRVRDPDDSLKVVIVCDMWLTGFDAPCLNTMYIDKPLVGHNLMQAITRINRVFRDKEGGLLVDYLGIAPELKKALANYTASDGKGKPTVDIDEAVRVFKSKLDVCRAKMHGYDYSTFRENYMTVSAGAMNHVLKPKDGKVEFDKCVLLLTKAFSLVSALEEIREYKDEVAFFDSIRNAIKKVTSSKTKLSEDKVKHSLRQLVSKAIISGEVVDIFKSAGLNKPEISVLDDDFLEDVRNMEHKNLAIELLQKLIDDEITARTAKNAANQIAFSERLNKAVAKYRNRSVETSQVIEALIALAKELKNAADEGEELGLSVEEKAFYDALLRDGSAASEMKNEDLITIAIKLADTIRKSAKPDWAVRENLRASMRLKIKKILSRSGYPPDKTDEAIKYVVEQAERIAYQ
jgi:type I restriction enzyme R subunit